MAIRQIGYFDDGALRAGTGRYLTEIIGALDRKRFQPVFFAPHARPWHEDFRRLDVELVYGVKPRPDPCDAPSSGEPAAVPTRRLVLPQAASWTLGLGRDILRLRALFRMRPVDLLHSNNTGAEPAPIAARMAGVPRVIGTLHVLPSYDLDGVRGGTRYRLLEKASMRALDHVIGCCEAARDAWDARSGLPSGGATVIHNGIRLDRVARRYSRLEARELLDLPTESCIAVMLGNLHRYKGQEFLIRALPAIVARHPNFVVAIGGTGPAEAGLKQLIGDLGVQRHVRMLGFCSDVGALLDAADMYVQSSLVEAFPIAILEAAAAGLPIVATAVGGVPEAIEDGQTGLLVPPADSAGLARAIGSLIECPERARELGQAGAARVKLHFTTDQMLAKTTALYDRLLG